MVARWKIMISETESPPEIRIIPPWVIIIVGKWSVIVFGPKIDLLTREERISIFHLAERFSLLSYNFTRHGDLSSFLEDIWIQILVSENQKSSFRVSRILRFSPQAQGLLKDFDLSGPVFLIDRVDDLSAPNN
jgi:hypothetical protein